MGLDLCLVLKMKVKVEGCLHEPPRLGASYSPPCSPFPGLPSPDVAGSWASLKWGWRRRQLVKGVSTGKTVVSRESAVGEEAQAFRQETERMPCR